MLLLKKLITSSLRLFLTTVLVVCFGHFTPAQQVKHYAFAHFTTANGLPSNFINSIVQDKQGYLWFATVNGIARYDGYRFLNFSSPKNDPTFKFENVAQLYYDTHHNIWFITADYRAGILNASDFTIREVNAQAMNRSAYQPCSFLETEEGTLIVQEYMGNTYRYDSLRNRFVLDSITIPFPHKWHGSKIAWDPFIKKYWLGADSGLALYNPAKKILSYPGHNMEYDPIVEKYKNERYVLNVYVDKGNNISFYTWLPNAGNPFLHSYNRQRSEGVRINLSDKLGIDYHEIGGFVEQRNGRMWVHGRPVFAEWLPDRKSFAPVANEYHTEQSLKYDAIRTCFEDGETNMWVATDNGLFLFNPDAQLFNNYAFSKPGLKGAFEFSVTSVLQLKDSSVFVGCWGPGLFVFDKYFNPLPVPKNLEAILTKSHSIWHMHQHTKTGKVWMVLQGGDVIVYNPKSGSAIRYVLDVFEGRTIRQVVEDSTGNLWFGTQNGAIIKWNYSKSNGNPETSYAKVVTKAGMILKLMTDREGFVWAAGYATGLYKIDPNTETVLQQFTKDNSKGQRLIDDVVTDMIQYNSNTIIAVAKSLNLIDLRTNSISYLSTDNGLPSNTGICVEKDAFGIVWLGMINGLCRINLQEELFTVYNRSNGIEYDNFNAAGAFHLQDGRIVFITDHNFISFLPQHFVSGVGIPPDPEICSITVGDEMLSVDSLQKAGKTILSYDNSSIAIQFSILSFLKQKQPNYEYMLENFDKDWIKIVGTNEAAYSYLPPGRYTFKVKAVTQDGLTNGKPTEIQIVVQPPFWRTWWFYGLMTLLAVMILYIIDKERQKKRQALQAVRTQIAGDLHEEINVTLNDINLLSEIAKIKADKDLDRSKDYIDQISTKSRVMIESMDDILWSIKPENDSMQRMLLRIYEFTEGVKKTNNLNAELTVDKEVERLMLDMKTRHEFLLFYKDALVYVIQHAVCSPVYISLEYVKAKLALKLLAQCNHVEGSTVQTAALEYRMQRRADALNGVVDIMSDRKSISIILHTAI